MAAIDGLKYRSLVMGILTTQLWLEVQDNLKSTTLSDEDIKAQMSELEFKMETLLGPEFEDIYKADEESFAIMMGRLQDIAEWVSTAKFEDVIDLGRALKEGLIKFED